MILYGFRNISRTAKPRPNGPTQSSKEANASRDSGLSSFWSQVPHEWFLHFYVVSVLASCFWLFQYLIDGSFLSQITSGANVDPRASMKFSQVCLAWFLMLAQGSRRLYECVTFGKKSSSQMWVGHYVVGILYYLFISAAVWIEGSRECEFCDVGYLPHSGS